MLLLGSSCFSPPPHGGQARIAERLERDVVFFRSFFGLIALIPWLVRGGVAG